MTHVLCEVNGCDRPSPDGAPACSTCALTLYEHLVLVNGDLAEDLELALARQVRFGAGGRRGGETPLPFGEEASEAIWVLRSAMVGWIRVLEETTPPRPAGPVCVTCKHGSCQLSRHRKPPPDTLAGMASWLTWRVEMLRHHEAGAEAVDELLEAVRQAQRTVDRPADRIYVGPCDECGQSVYARPGRQTGRCRDCELEYGVDEQREWMRAQTEDMVGSAAWVANVARGLGVTVSASTVRSWAKRGKLTPAAYAEPLKPGGEPRPLYRVGDVVTLAAGGNLDPAS